jgi:hypothetical protein
VNRQLSLRIVWTRSFSVGIVSFSHVKREANKVAHVLAKECFLNNLSCNWVDEPPRFILGKIPNDVIYVDYL